MRFRHLLFLALGGGAVLSGCRRPAEFPQIDPDALQVLVDRERGKAVLVDFWATWCPPCRKLFPHILELEQRWGPQRLAVITINLDPPEHYAAALSFLGGQRAKTRNFFSRWGAARESFEAFDLDGVPTFRIYGRDGQLHRTILGESLEEIDLAVAEALQQ
jgi:thiol-disulfide isomerase/thioredoxin